jgi:hypothetical protein
MRVDDASLARVWRQPSSTLRNFERIQILMRVDENLISLRAR